MNDTLCSRNIYLKLFPDSYFRVNILNYFPENTAGVIVIFYRRTDYENYDEQTTEPEAMTRDDLIEILSDVTMLLGDALTKYVDLNESIADAGIEAQALTLDALQARKADEKLKLTKLKDATRRRRELEKANQHGAPAKRPANESRTSGTVYLRDGASRVIGVMHMLGKGRTDYLYPSARGPTDQALLSNST